MNKSTRIFLLLAVLVIASVSSVSSVSAFSKVAARYSVIEFYGNSSKPIGSVDRIGIGLQGFVFQDDFFQSFDIDAVDVYENSAQIGFSYGSLVNTNTLFSVGFSFTDVKHKENFEQISNGFIYSYYYPKIFKIRMYNVDFNLNYYFGSPVKQVLTPYAGVGLQAGLLSVSVSNFASESDFVSALSFNFGADLNIWQATNKMAKLNLSSVNSYQIYASDNRPKYMTIGLGLKYYFRP